MNFALQGVWVFKSSSGEEDYLQIFEDGRMVQFNRQPAPASSRQTIVLRGCPQEKGSFRIATGSDASGYVLSIRRKGEDLEIVYPETILLGRRVPPHELPNWYADELAKAKWEETRT